MMVAAFMQNQIGARPCRQDILVQIFQINPRPNINGGFFRFGIIKLGITLKIRAGLAKGGFAKPHKALNIPTLHGLNIGININ